MDLIFRVLNPPRRRGSCALGKRRFTLSVHLDCPVAVAVGEETVPIAADEVSHRMEPQRQAAHLVEMCPSEVMVKPPEVSTTRVSTTMVKVIRATTRVGAATVVWFTDRVSAPRTTGTATSATGWDILPNFVRIKQYIMLSMIRIVMTCIRGDIKIHQGPSQPFSPYCQLGYINLPPFTLT